MSNSFRYYQQEADDAIYNELLINGKCIVKMFCGTGKSQVMRYCRVAQNKNLVVYVVPSLSLLEQFYEDYFIKKMDFPLKNILRISSEEGSTTEIKNIEKFLNKKKNKIICVTYQSFETLINSLGDIKIDVCIFDEAHHVVSDTYKLLIFETSVCEKQIFFTATPKNANGVIMYDKDNLEAEMCGKLVYDYSYFKGVMEGYLNPFEIRLDFYTENTNNSVYESIARAILASGNSRVLTFHADVNGERDTSVLQFVDEQLFIVTFNKVLHVEFPEKIGFYKGIKMIGLHSDIAMNQRKRILEQFDTTPDDEVFIISSCQTIGEGIDTKNANMCVFVDPKSSFVAITQNIGRIVRKIFGLEKPNSTILIPCWVNKEKYLSCDGNKDKCDEVIRQDLNKNGNFNGILNVISALKQESEDLFDACLNYPSTYSPQEIEGNLSKYGYQLEEPISLPESLEYVLDTEIDLDDEESDEELLLRVAEENNVTIEVHSNLLETPIEYYGEQEEGKEVVRIFKSYDEEIEEVLYQPILKKDGTKRNRDTIEPLRRENRFNVKVHTNPNIKVLWNLASDMDLSRDICSCIIDCEVVDMWFLRFEELKSFIDANERRPYCKIQVEKQLGNWLSDQQKYYKKKTMGMKHTKRYNLWTQFLEDYKEYFVSNEETWIQKFEELKSFIDSNNRTPTETSKILYESQLGGWLTHQKQNYKKKTVGMKDAKRYNLWSQFLEDYNEYLLTGKELWFKNFENLKIFINENKRRPLLTSKNQEENQLGSWLCNQLHCYKNKTQRMKDEELYKLWDQFVKDYKEYLLTSEESWFQNFEDLKIFIDNNKRRPSISIQEEKQLGLWLAVQLRNYKPKVYSMKYEERYNLWTQFMEDYNEYLLTGRELWFKNFEDLKIFIDTNKRVPLNVENNQDETYLSKWISHQKENYKKEVQSMKDGEQYNLWTQFLEDYKEYFISDDEKWFQKFEELKTFIDANNRTPSSSPKTPAELQIGRWLITQKKHYNNKTEGMKVNSRYNLWSQFLENNKKYFVSNDEIWFQNFEALKMFIIDNQRRPQNTLNNSDEKQLSEWISTQQQNYKQKTDGMKDNTRYNIWTQFLEDYKEYFVSDQELWFQKFEELKTFIDANNRTPSSSSKTPAELQIGRWLITQKKHYNNKTEGMKVNSRYNIWTQFLEEYKEYFVSDEEVWFERFETCKMFMCANKRRPSPYSKINEEKQMGSWLHHQIHNYKTKTRKMKDESRYNLWTQFLEDHKNTL